MRKDFYLDESHFYPGGSLLIQARISRVKTFSVWKEKDTKVNEKRKICSMGQRRPQLCGLSTGYSCCVILCREKEHDPSLHAFISNQLKHAYKATIINWRKMPWRKYAGRNAIGCRKSRFNSVHLWSA